MISTKDPIGKNESHNLSIEYFFGITHFVPHVVNRERPTQPVSLKRTSSNSQTSDIGTDINLQTFDISIRNNTIQKASHLETSVAQDHFDDICESLEPNNSGSDKFKKFRDSGQPAIPNESDDNIIDQLESSTFETFAESTRLVKFKSRGCRADVTHLNIPLQERHQWGLFSIYNPPEISGQPAKESFILEFQKLEKALTNLTHQVQQDLFRCRNSYILDKSTKYEQIELELKKQLTMVTKFGRTLCNLYKLNSTNAISQCLLEKTKHDLMTTENLILNTILQFQLHNNINPGFV